MRCVFIVAAFAVAGVAAPALAEPGDTGDARYSFGVSAGVGSLTADGDGTEATLPLQLRVDIRDRVAVEVGADATCATSPWCAASAFYRIGALVYLGGPSARGYAYGRIAYFLSPPEPVDGDRHSYNAELHAGAGAGFEYAPDRLGFYVEAGVLSDLEADYVGLQIAAGVIVRFGRVRDQTSAASRVAGP